MFYKTPLPEGNSIGDNNPGRLIVFIGIAAEGPALQPCYIAGPEQAARTFGDSPLTRAYRMAYTINPGADYCLMRINGSAASLDLTIDRSAYGDDNVHFILDAVEAGSSYNDVEVYIEQDSDGNALVIEHDGIINVYHLAAYPELGLLTDAINRDASLGLSPVTATVTDLFEESENLVPLFGGGRLSLSGGSDKTDASKNEIYCMLEKAYERLEGLRTDIVVPVGVYFDDTVTSYFYGDASSLYLSAWFTGGADRLTLTDGDEHASFHGQLIDFCRRQMARGLMCHGVLGMRPMPDEETLAESDWDYIHGLSRVTCFNNRMGFVKDQTDFGHHISIVLGDLWFEDKYRSGAPAYAAAIAAAGPETTTNWPLVNIQSQRTQLADEVLRAASALGLVVFYNSIKNGLSVYNGVTAAPTDTALHYVANVRTGQYLIHMLRMALDPYIGSTSGIISIRDAIGNTVEDVLAGALKVGLIQSYSHSMAVKRISTSAMVIDINVTFRPKYSVEDISTSTTVVTGTGSEQ